MLPLIYIRGEGWVYPEPTNRTEAEIKEIYNGYTSAKSCDRQGRRCSTCGNSYGDHYGDSCDYPYAGRVWTD